MTRICVLGVGSPNGDDQAGWLVVDALAALGFPQAGLALTLEKLDRPGVTLVGRLARADWGILVDAMQGGGPPGRIQAFGQDAWPDYTHGLSSHGVGVLDALALARELDSLPRRMDLYGIEIGAANPGEDASSAIREAARQLGRSIAANLAAILQQQA